MDAIKPYRPPIMRRRLAESYRWSENETKILIDSVTAALKKPHGKFERPTAKIFYTNMSKYFESNKLNWSIMRSKMRHLKLSYMKAREWIENVGSELFESDQKHVKARVKKLCPHYNKLDEIFADALNSDPIGFRLIDDETDTNAGREQIKNGEDSICDLVPKEEINDESIFDDDDRTFDDAEQSTTDTIINDCDDFNVTKQTPTRVSIFSNSNIESPPTKEETKTSQRKENNLDERRFILEKQKFQFNYALERRKICLEERKLKFEMEKFEKTQKLRKYEIDKQFAIRQMEIEKEERFRRLEVTLHKHSRMNNSQPSIRTEIDEEEEDEQETMFGDF